MFIRFTYVFLVLIKPTVLFNLIIFRITTILSYNNAVIQFVLMKNISVKHMVRYLVYHNVEINDHPLLTLP